MNNTTVSIGNDHYKTTIKSGTHEWLADEPQSLGGTNLGPSPYELLLSALGACTVITLRMYADRKEWKIDRISVELSHERKHAEDCLNCDDASAKLDHITKIITITGDVDEKQQNRMLKIADKCPVNKTLSSEIVMKTLLVES